MSEQASPLDFEMDLAGFGPRLGQVIAHLQLNQSEFARRVGVSPGFVSEMTRGNKRPGAEFLLAIHKVFGVSTDWLLAGEGTMLGGSGIDVALLRAIHLQVAIARAAVAECDPTARALLLLVRDGRLNEVAADPELGAFLDRLCPEDGDVDLATELYNGHLGTDDPATRQRNLLTAAVAHFESRKPLDKLATLAKAAGATIQINLGANQHNAGRDYYEG
jgi:transcriptional regulator with XRE-family HTH domain